MFTIATVAALAFVAMGIFLHMIMAARPKPAPPGVVPAIADRAVALFVALSFAALALTGFFAVIVAGTHLGGYSLLLHVSAGGALAFFFIAYMFLRCERVSRDEAPHGYRWSFWLLALSVLTLILTAALGMIPLFGTYGQDMLMLIHRYAALASMLAGIVLCYHAMRLYAVQPTR